MQRTSPRNEGCEPHIHLPSSAVMHWQDKPQNGFEGQQGLHMGEPEGCGKQRLHSQRACRQSHILRDSAWRKSYERSLGQTHLLILEASWRRRRRLRLRLGTEMLTAAVWGSLFYHEDAGDGRQHFGILSLACWR